MDINALLAALKPAEPAAEYCLFWIQGWPVCMTKAEWSGWAQAIGSIVGLGIAIWAANRATRAARQLHLEAVRMQAAQQIAHAMTILAGVTHAADNAMHAIDRRRRPIRHTGVQGAIPLLQQTALLPMPADATTCILEATEGLLLMLQCIEAVNERNETNPVGTHINASAGHEKVTRAKERLVGIMQSYADATPGKT